MFKVQLWGTALGLAVGVAACNFSPGVPNGESSGSGAGGMSGTTTGSGGDGAGNRTGTGGSVNTGNGTGGSNGDINLGGDAGAPACGQMNVGIMPLPPDILIVQDKSGSMDENDSGKNCTRGCGSNSKWSQVATALTQVVSSTQSSINWGLKFFSDDKSTCGASGPPVVNVGSMNGTAVSNAISGTSPGGNTPTREAITSGAAYLATLSDANPKYLLLATDGLPNCPASLDCTSMSDPSSSCTRTDNPSEDMAAEQAILDAATQGFNTFVIGIGDVSSAVDTLNKMAVNGGQAQTGGTTSYYAATDPAALEAALNAIIGAVASCDISLSGAPAGFTNVAISADTAAGKTIEIPEDPANGWSYGPNMTSVTLNGTSCAGLKDGTYSNFQFYYACPGTSIHIGAVLPR